MKLEEFIKQSLIDIKKGVDSANDEIGDDVCKYPYLLGVDLSGKGSESIKFDIEVSTNNEGVISIAGGIGTVGLFGRSKDKKESRNRISFEIHINGAI